MTEPTTSRVLPSTIDGDGWFKTSNAFARDPSLSTGAVRVLLWLASQAETHDIYRTVMARELGGVSQTTIRKWLREAEATPYLTITPTGGKDHQGNPTYIYHVRLSAGESVSETDSDRCESVSETDSDRCQLLTAKKTSLKEDQSLSLSRSKPVPTVIDGWEPNHANRSSCSKFGLDLDEMLTQFLATNAATEKRGDWSRTFGAFLRDVEDGVADDRWPPSWEGEVAE